MSTPLSAAGASSESHAWHELEDVFARLGQLARSAIAPHEFYRTVLDESIRALSALGGAVWLRSTGGLFQPIVQVDWPRHAFAQDEPARRAHESLLVEAAASGHVVTVSPHSGDPGDIGNPTDHVLLIAPVNLPDHGATDQTAPNRPGESASGGTTSTPAMIELMVRVGASPANYRGYQEFLTAVCDLAADFHAFDELRQLRQGETYRGQLLALSHDVHRQFNLSETAYIVANEGRRVVGCDRLSVLVARGRRCRLLATSGVSRAERRSGATRGLEQVAELVRHTDEPAIYTDGQSDALPPVAEALEQHAEESHARHVAAVPIRRPIDHVDAESQLTSPQSHGKRHDPPLFVMVAERFDAGEGELHRDRLVEVAAICGTALYNALEYDRLPLGWLLRPVGSVKQAITAHLPRSLLVLGVVSAAVASLVLVPADFNIEAPGTLQPVVRRDVFAPRSGLVDEVLIAHGADVAAGQPLVRMRDASLELELKRVDGELETAQRQLDAVRATRTNRAIRDANPTDAYRLSAEEREIQQRLENLRRELDLLNHERQQLVVTSPIAGRVLTWDVANRLAARLVERGEVLVTVADLSADWQLELDVPDDRIGHVLAAQQELQRNLPVRFRLSSDDREQHRGYVAEICQTADVATDEATAASPTVLVKVALNSAELGDAARRELRPGVSARAQIACGRRPVGYVWLHDIWDAAIEWLRF
ncbi:MAG: efflux RND transporter periplasmic adaptor subunit [Pirellulales bacterium]